MSALYVNEVLPKLYGCAENPQQWTTVLDTLRDQLEVSSLVIQVFTQHPDGGFEQSLELRDSFSLEHAALHDKWVNNPQNPRFDVALTASQAILRDEDIFPQDCEKYRRFQTRLMQANLGRSISLEIQATNNRYICMIAHRQHGDGRPFNAPYEQFFRELSPHLQQSMRLCEKVEALSRQQCLVSSATDCFNTAVVILDKSGQVSWQNQAFSRLLVRSEHLKLVHGHIQCRRSSDQQHLNTLLTKALKTTFNQRYVATLGQYESTPLQILMVPIQASTLFGHPSSNQAVAIFMSEHHQGLSLCDQDIGQLFGLTQAESQLAVALANGSTLVDYADNKGIAVGTARIHLKNIFSKMDVSRQPELVKSLWSSVSATLLRGQN